jgi:hypothetical protein
VQEGLDLERFNHLLATHKTDTEGVNFPLSNDEWTNLKTEVLAYETLPELLYAGVDTTYAILTDPEGPYNFAGMLTPDNTDTAEAYKALIFKSVEAVKELKAFYVEALKDPDAGACQTSAILGNFPIQDWPRLTQMVKRYSMFK